MDETKNSRVELLKSALTSLREADLLNDHPWALSTSGSELAELIVRVFRKLMPSGPPRAGKRLDTRWGVFGIMAAQYFAPVLLGTPSPSSLREAWENMDRSILLFVHGRTDNLSDSELALYRFTANEPEPAPNSTLSDWHRKGMEQLAEMVEVELKQPENSEASAGARRLMWKRVGAILGMVVLVLTLFLGWKAWGMYQHVKAIEQKVDALNAYLDPKPGLEQIPEIADQVHELRVELDDLQGESEPYLWLTPFLGWLPKYGGEINQAEDLLDLAQNLATAADEGLSAVTPAIETRLQTEGPLDIMDLILQLQDASPQLLNAQVALVQAQAARERIQVESLSPRVREMIEGKIDPLFTSITGTFPMEDAITMVSVAPTLLGSGKAGPQTYLILMQNEDELRPTGGYLTAVGSAVVKDGKLLSMNIESSELVDDLSKPYPIPPWQFEKFMNLDMFLFRDSNWFTDFPTTVSWAEYFYSYSRAASADGVMTIDTHVIVRLLETLGPVNVENVDTPITSENVIEYLRSGEQSPPAGVSGTWDRKQFLGKLAQPLLEKLLGARGETWTHLAPVMIGLLDERHILLQFDNDETTTLLEHHGWDGAVRIPNDSDFLMAVEANMGYNKSNAVMQTALSYRVDLAEPDHPKAILELVQKHLSTADIECLPYASDPLYLVNQYSGEIHEPTYPMDECHWAYFRIYTPAGTRLVRSTPREIPAESTWLGVAIPGHTDDLGSEDIPNAQVFGMMVMTPTQQTTRTEFEYNLPPQVVNKDEENDLWTYTLKVQKQPGTLAHPLLLTIHLPDGAHIEDSSIEFVEKNGLWTAQLDLRQDLNIELSFKLE
jgi:hypothetical protein